MYVDPFVAGVISTILVELVVIVILVFATFEKGKKR